MILTRLFISLTFSQGNFAGGLSKETFFIFLNFFLIHINQNIEGESCQALTEG